jgi:hypothetical protein
MKFIHERNSDAPIKVRGFTVGFGWEPSQVFVILWNWTFALVDDTQKEEM